MNLNVMASVYGRGATDRAIHNRLYGVRKLAKELADEARKNGTQLPQETPRAARTPRTPRTQPTGKSKPSAIPSQLKRKLFATAPFKTGKSASPQQGHSVVDPISVDSDDDNEDENVSSDEKSAKSEATVPGDEQQLIKKEESKEKSNVAAVPKIEPCFVVPPFSEYEDFGIGSEQPRVNSQRNGYVDAAMPSMQNAASGYRYEAFDDRYSMFDGIA